MPIPNVTKDDVFLAILAMDTYHRGGHAGLGENSGLLETVGTQIGTASIARTTESDPEEKAAAQAVGFYAIEYNWNDKNVYAYRGTDKGFKDFSSTGDIVNGYTLSAGLPDAAQALAAAKFFTDGQGAKSNANANAIITGQSLGGGLAGFVAMHLPTGDAG